MQWTEAVDEYIQSLKPIKRSPELVQRILSLIDLSSLNENDTEEKIALLCEKAQTPIGHVAAVCVYPKFVRMVATQFAGTHVKADTVANFPDGTNTLENVLIEINDALEGGAQEIDVVLPYQRYLAGERQYAQTFVETCKAACGNDVILKVILETAILQDTSIIADACFDVLTAGADFVKTSTGKKAEGATLEAAATMMLVIRHLFSQLKKPLGIKVAGGIGKLKLAAQYLELADQIMGPKWAKPTTFRIGSSMLVDEIMKEMIG